jgi:large subunit ribosomal protein L21|tara:strand:- start:1507 stop:1821 length:315 start_codon:yes stop_codon:yes gene_type:complete
MKYAIVEISGRQVWVEDGKFYNLNYIATNPGNKILLNRVLMLNDNGNIQLGKPYLDGVKIEATVLQHIKGPKLLVYKMKPKKKYRRKTGHRQQLTRLMIDKIGS